MLFSCGDNTKKKEKVYKIKESAKDINILEINNLFSNIQPGEKGIMFYTLGDVLDTGVTYGQGMNFYLPWNEMIVYEPKDYEYRPNMYRSPNLETYGDHNIEDTQQISKSTQPVIVIGNGDSSLPIILGGQ